jgi:regulator of RNase E activity RraA
MNKNPLKPTAEDQELVLLFAGLDTPAVSDAMDKLGLHGQALGITPLADYPTAVVGPAFTVKYVPAGVPAGTVGDFIDEVAEGDVVVINNDGRTDCSVWGDIMTQYAGLRGIGGTVIDGVCRDVNRALADGYPLFTAGLVIDGGVRDTAALAARHFPVFARGISVRGTRKVCAPSVGQVEATLANGKVRADKEEAIMGQLRQGRTTVDLLGLSQQGAHP